jgi:hypothetical protein
MVACHHDGTYSSNSDESDVEERVARAPVRPSKVVNKPEIKD